ncbi:MAG: TonB-dependent receptor domain-containing protein [Gemmatimonadota bacterium]
MICSALCRRLSSQAAVARYGAVAILVAVAFVAPGSVAGQSGSIRGVVLDGDSRTPVPMASILLRGTGLRGLSADDGRFDISPLSPGSYQLVIVHSSFREATFEVEVAAGQATDVEVVLERPVFEVPALVVTASRNATRPGDAPVSVSVMSGEDIDRRDVISLSEALPYAQGVIFNAGQMDIRGATGLSRGVGSRVLMLLDGHRVLSGVGSEINLDALPVLDVERIEIVKGPHSTLFGSNALAGVANVITKRPSSTPETIVRAYYGFFDTPGDVAFTDESLAMQGLKVQHSNRIGDVGATLYLGREGTDGFRQNGRLERWSGRIKTVFPVESANPWEIFASFTRQDKEEFFTWLSEDRPLEVNPIELGDWTRKDDLVLGVTANPIVTPDLRLQIRPSIYYAQVQNFFYNNDNFHRSTRYGTDVQLSLYPNRDHAVTLGGEMAYTPVTSNFLGDRDPRVRDLAAFVQDEVVLSDEVRASLGARLDYHKATLANEDLSLSPKVGVVFQPNERLSVRTSISRGYRAPSVSEQFTATTVFGFTVIPNFELSGETAWAGEVGATAQVTDRIWIDAGLFWTEYSNLIEPSAAPGQLFVFQFRNVAAAMVRGLDTGIRVGIIPRNLMFAVNYVLLDTEDSRTGRQLPYRSTHNLTTTLSGWKDRFAVDVRYRSRVHEVLAFPLDTRSSIVVVDLRAGHRFGRFDVQAKIENLFQNIYVDVQERSPGQTRAFRLTVTPRF